jgi:deoxyribodipyrimidine photolyase
MRGKLYRASRKSQGAASKGHEVRIARRIEARDPIYNLAEFEAALTSDELWKAAERQLVSEGRNHNDFRRL